MLVIQRITGESFMIGDIPITVTILGVKGRQVRVGIEAPREVKVLREELWLKQQPQKVAL